MNIKNLFLSFFIMICGVSAVAQTTGAEDSVESPNSIKSLLNGTTSPRHFDNHFTIAPPEGYVLIDEENSRTFLVDMCGNPEESVDGVLGCLIPNVNNIYEEPIPYFFVIGDDMCGYVQDTDASTINYDELLKEMQKESKAANDEYRKSHPEYPMVKLLGWAETPYYDKETHTLYWGKLLDFQENVNIINYDMRVLGKDGYVIIQAVGDEDCLKELKSVGQQMLGNVVFDSGYSYNDFDESKDHIAEWTIGGLIAGKVLTKVGFWALIAKGWKLILVAVVAIGAAIKKFFRKKSGEDDSDVMADEMT